MHLIDRAIDFETICVSRFFAWTTLCNASAEPCTEHLLAIDQDDVNALSLLNEALERNAWKMLAGRQRHDGKSICRDRCCGATGKRDEGSEEGECRGPWHAGIVRFRCFRPEAVVSWFRTTGTARHAVLVVAQAPGRSRFADANWAEQFARCANAALGKPVVHVDVPGMSLAY